MAAVCGARPRAAVGSAQPWDAVHFWRGPNMRSDAYAWVCVLLMTCSLDVGCVSAGLVFRNRHGSRFEIAFVSRQLQEGEINATNTTGEADEAISACVQAIRIENGLEQCEIDYREADCAGANMVTWTTLKGPIIALYVFGVLLMFLSLSIVCDEFFVPGETATDL